MPENDKLEKATSLIRMEADLFSTAFISNNIESCSKAINRSFKDLGIDNEDLKLLKEYLDNNLIFYVCLNKNDDFLSALKKLDVYSRLSEEAKKALENLDCICCCKISEKTCPIRKEAENIKKSILKQGDIK